MVVRSSGTANVRFKYMILRGEASIVDYKTGTSTIVGHTNSASAITVGAMLYDNIPPFTPVWPGVASFSSRGGTSTLQTNSNFLVRNKPDLIAPNRVNTTVNLGGLRVLMTETLSQLLWYVGRAPRGWCGGPADPGERNLLCRVP